MVSESSSSPEAGASAPPPASSRSCSQCKTPFNIVLLPVVLVVWAATFGVYLYAIPYAVLQTRPLHIFNIEDSTWTATPITGSMLATFMSMSGLLMIALKVVWLKITTKPMEKSRQIPGWYRPCEFAFKVCAVFAFLAMWLNGVFYQDAFPTINKTTLICWYVFEYLCLTGASVFDFLGHGMILISIIRFILLGIAFVMLFVGAGGWGVGNASETKIGNPDSEMSRNLLNIAQIVSFSIPFAWYLTLIPQFLSVSIHIIPAPPTGKEHGKYRKAPGSPANGDESDLDSSLTAGSDYRIISADSLSSGFEKIRQAEPVHSGNDESGIEATESRPLLRPKKDKKDNTGSVEKAGSVDSTETGTVNGTTKTTSIIGSSEASSSPAE